MNLRPRKGEAIAVNTIILVVLALVVLIIMIMLVVKYTQKGDRGLSGASNTCTMEPVNGVCQTSCSNPLDKIVYAQCDKKGEECCKRTVPIPS